MHASTHRSFVKKRREDKEVVPREAEQPHQLREPSQDVKLETEVGWLQGPVSSSLGETPHKHHVSLLPHTFALHHDMGTKSDSKWSLR